MSKFKPGQRVLVKQLRPSDGIPMRHLGTIVTILTNKSGNPDWPYSIVEDERWIWREDHFIDSGEITDPNLLFYLAKKQNRI